MKYPLFLNVDSGKKEVKFNLGIQINSKEDIDLLRKMKMNFLISKYGDSKYNSLNLELKKSNMKFIKYVSVPCGICYDCLKENARSWAVRCMLEAQQYRYNYFLTFTYDDEHLPGDRNLRKEDISNFNKKLKIYLSRNGYDSTFRFYACGEYGSTTARPHYHGIYFNLPLFDLQYYSKTKNGDFLYNSNFLTKIWGKGFVVIGELTMASASYVARYVDKKKILTKYEKDDLIKKGIVPEFSLMSRRPGIGANYYDTSKKKFIEDQDLNVYMPNGQVCSLPRYFKNKMKNDASFESSIDDLELMLEKNSDIGMFRQFNQASNMGIVDNVFKASKIIDDEKSKSKKNRL